jgi:hypothetical protein
MDVLLMVRSATDVGMLLMNGVLLMYINTTVYGVLPRHAIV